jgi:hypothetical protein
VPYGIAERVLFADLILANYRKYRMTLCRDFIGLSTQFITEDKIYQRLKYLEELYLIHMQLYIYR